MIKIQFHVYYYTLQIQCQRCGSKKQNYKLAFACTIYPIACSRSEIRSSASSIPTLNLINESASPFFILSSLGMDACVIDAGWLINDSTPPRLSANANNFVEDNTLFVSFSPSSFSTKLIIPPKPRICFFAIAYPE